jgi:hypothetical protein
VSSSSSVGFADGSSLAGVSFLSSFLSGLSPCLSESCLFSVEFDDSDDDPVPEPDVVPSSATATPAPAIIASGTPAVMTPALSHSKSRSIMLSPVPTSANRSLSSLTKGGSTQTAYGVMRPSNPYSGQYPPILRRTSART